MSYKRTLQKRIKPHKKPKTDWHHTPKGMEERGKLKAQNTEHTEEYKKTHK